MSRTRSGRRASPADDAAAVLAAAMRAAPVAIVAVDRAGRIRRWSAAAERILRWTEAEVVSRPLSSVLGPAAAALLEQARGAAEATAPLALEGTRKDGTAVPLTVWCAPMRAGRGAPAGVVAVLQEMNSSRVIEQRFLEAQRLEVIDRIAGAIAHDLKNVLSAIKGFAIVAGEGMGGDDPARTDMDQILKAAERGAALAQKLLAFSRNAVVQPNVLDVNQLLQALDKTLRRLLGTRVELTLQPTPGIGLVRADAAQVEQVIVNLVLNARDAMPAGGRLLVATAETVLDEPAARAAGVAPGRYVRLAVTDTGRGMAPETQARMFEPFFTTKEPEHALGLGLPATLNIVRQMGGQIGARSAPGDGTTFTVDIPVTSDPLPREASGAPAGARRDERAGGETVLIVEDDDLVRLLTAKVLRRRGYQVLEASTAPEATQRAGGHAGPIHLLLSDVGLPQVSGPDLARRLREQRPEMKVLFMSGYGRSALAERGLVPDAGVLEKPFSPDALLDRIRTALEES